MKRTLLFALFTFSLIYFEFNVVRAQNPLRFKKEVDRIDSVNGQYSYGDSVILFTGSSSIRMWNDIQEYFPNCKIVNTGFGGSEMSDLLYFYNDLIIKYYPYKVFIYEGDNDIANSKAPKTIIETADSLIQKIHYKFPATQIILISAKPSILRWSFKNEYIELNRLYKDYCKNHSNIDFINIWNVMLDENNKLRKDLFLEDGLHMNSKGYNLWAQKLKEKFIWLNF